MLPPKAVKTNITLERMRHLLVAGWNYIALTFNYRLEFRRYGLESELV